MTGALLMGTTLPTIVGMGVISRSIGVMFDKRGHARPGQRKGTVVVGVAQTKAKADSFAIKYRKALKRRGAPYAGRVNVKKVSGGYTVTYRKG